MDYYGICYNDPLDSHILLERGWNSLFWIIATTMDKIRGWKRKKKDTVNLGGKINGGRGRKNRGE